MIRSLTVFYLHKPNRQDARRLPVVEYGIADAFREDRLLAAGKALERALAS